MTKILISISLIFLLISACAKPTYEDATKWYSGCYPQPIYHPGDTLAFDQPPGIDEVLCAEDCDATFNCNYALPNESSKREDVEREKSCAESLHLCKFECVEKEHPMAVHVEGGYYSDGSYYAVCYYVFDNIHPTKDKYKKNKWQKDRDECMDLALENFPAKIWDQKGIIRFYWAKKYYKGCLKERGY